MFESSQYRPLCAHCSRPILSVSCCFAFVYILHYFYPICKMFKANSDSVIILVALQTMPMSYNWTTEFVWMFSLCQHTYHFNHWRIQGAMALPNTGSLLENGCKNSDTKAKNTPTSLCSLLLLICDIKHQC